VSRRRSHAIPIQRRIHLFERLYADLKANEPYAKGGEISISFTVSRDPDRDFIETNTNRQELRSYLTGFRQFISPDDPVYLGTILHVLPRHIDDVELRARLSRAMDAWKAALGIPSVFAPIALGPYAAGSETARLYLYGGVFHSDPDLSDVWDAIGPDQQRFIEYQFRQFEGKVRLVFIEVRQVIVAAREGGFLRDEPLDLGSMADAGGEPEAPKTP